MNLDLDRLVRRILGADSYVARLLGWPSTNNVLHKELRDLVSSKFEVDLGTEFTRGRGIALSQDLLRDDKMQSTY